MKKIRLVLISILLSLLLSCQNNKQVEYKIGVSQCSDDLCRETMNKELMFAASLRPNVALEIKKVKDNTEQQIKDIEYFINEKFDLLVISPNEPKEIKTTEN